MWVRGQRARSLARDEACSDLTRSRMHSHRVPGSGGYSLGLGSLSRDHSQVDFEAFESDRALKRKRHPEPTRKRRALRKIGPRARMRLLKRSGAALDDGEGGQLDALRAQRLSSPACCPDGCTCTDAKTCPCVRNGIECYVDGGNWVCGCWKTKCRNANGRYVYNLNATNAYRRRVCPSSLGKSCN